MHDPRTSLKTCEELIHVFEGEASAARQAGSRVPVYGAVSPCTLSPCCFHYSTPFRVEGHILTLLTLALMMTAAQRASGINQSKPDACSYL